MVNITFVPVCVVGFLGGGFLFFFEELYFHGRQIQGLNASEQFVLQCDHQQLPS